MKKLLILFLAISMSVASFTGCSKKNQESSGSNSVKTSSPSDKQVTMQIGMTAAEGSTWVDMSRKMSKIVAEKSSGSIKLDVFPSGQLGSQTDLYDQMQAGASVIGVGTPAYFGDMGIGDFGIISGPYLFKSWKEVETVTASKWFKDLEQQLEKKGLKVLSFNLQAGKRHTLATKPIKSVADIKGKKIRVPNATIYIKTYEALGATPVPMNLGEVYTSLAQGVIEGEDNAIPTMASEKHYEVAKYLIMDGHIYDLQCLVTGTSFFNSLTPNQQKALVESAEEAASLFNKATEESMNGTIAKMKSEGVTVIDDLNLDEFAKATSSFYSDKVVTQKWSKDLLKTVNSILGR